MQKHKIDPDLTFISHLHDADLVLLASFLFQELKTESAIEELETSSISSPLAMRSFYLDFIFSAFYSIEGEYSLASALNHSHGSYRCRLQDMCTQLNITDGFKHDIEILELNLFMKLIEYSMNGLTQNDLLIISRDLQLNLSDPTPTQISLALTAAVKTSNSVALKITTMFLSSYFELRENTVIHQMVELTHPALASLQKAVNVTLNSNWLMEKLSPLGQHQFLLPIYFIVAYLRQKSFILA
ncbi:hypothetical protein [Providencia rettgeri]|uniref:hypothetical protein n=1 Tax=Providencia rettgeri TaxID=587 RepID=UPI002362CF4B|nr:hypothetical protein [Providencia rettgeri]